MFRWFKSSPPAQIPTPPEESWMRIESAGGNPSAYLRLSAIVAISLKENEIKVVTLSEPFIFSFDTKEKALSEFKLMRNIVNNS